MASVSASTVTFQPLSKSLITKITQENGRISSIVRLGWAKSSFPTLRTSRLNIICAAKPELTEKVCGIVRKQLALAPETSLTGETKFSEIGADSLDTVEIVMALEEEFGINVEEESAQNITTIQEAAEVIDKLLEKK